MPSKLKKAIGAVKDQTSISIAKVASNNSSNLEVAVLKATTHDDVPVDNRYVREVLQLVSADKAYAAACARAIGKRIGRTRNWIVTLKSLLLVLRIFQDGDPYFPREVLHAMKRGAKIFNLSSFRDDSNSSPWDFTAFVRTFALYLDERLDCFLTGKLQRRFTHRQTDSSSRRGRRPDEPVREMKPVMLLDRIGHWQRLLERAIATRPTGAAKTNRLVQIALYAVVEESFDLYKDISDGLALIFDNFFHLEHQFGVIAFQTCMRAAKQYEELAEFYQICKSVGVGRTSEYPSIQKISEELIETLQEFLKDHSSYPVHSKSPNNHPSFLLLPGPTAPRRSRHNSFDGQSEFSVSTTRNSRHGSYGGQSEFSIATDGSSETGSELGSLSTSLEDLLSATLTTGKNPAISIDLETYSQRSDNFKLSESGSAKSLPASNSFADLLSLDDWNEDEENQDGEEAVPSSSKATTQNNVAHLEQNNANTGWELVLFKTPPNEAPPPPSVDNNFTSSSNYNLESLFDQVSSSFLPATGLNSFALDALYNQSPMSVPHHYNPFLQEEFPTASAPHPGASQPPDMFSLVPTLQATPTYSTQNLSFAPAFQSTPTFPAPSPTETAVHNEFSSAPTFQATPTFSARSPASTEVQNEFSSVSTFQATPTFSAQSPASTAMHNEFSSAPTFQATPEFSAQSPTSTAMQNEFSTAPSFQSTSAVTLQASPAGVAKQDETDSFATLFKDQIFSGSNTSPPNLMQEQQLWLQNQNKIIAKRMP